MLSTRYRSRRAIVALITGLLLWANAAIGRRTSVISAASGALIGGCIVVLAEEGRPGPYKSVVTASDGTVDLPDAFTGTLLFVHQSYIAREAAVNVESIALTPGTPMPAPPAEAALRIYDRSWIGRFDVETLPTLPATAPLSCGSPKTVFDRHDDGMPRMIAQASMPRLHSAKTTTLNIRVRVPNQQKLTGFVYLADATDPAKESSEPPRSRAIASDGTVSFDHVPFSPHIVITAVNGFGPVATLFKAPSPATSMIEPRAPLVANGMIKCKEPLQGLSLHAELRVRELPNFPIRRTVEIGDHAFTVSDLAPGEIIVTAAAKERREDTRRLIISEEPRRIEVGALCPGEPFVIRGIVQADRKAVEGASVRYGDVTTKTDNAGRFTMKVVMPTEGSLEVTRDGFAPWKRWYEPSAPGTALTITLQRGYRLRGTVVDARTGKPVRAFSVMVYRNDVPGKLLNQRFSPESGVFRTPVIDERASTMLLQAEAYEPKTMELSKETQIDKATGDHDIGVVALSPAPVVIGRVVDESTTPISGAVIRLRDTALAEWDTGIPGYTTFETTAAADGTFRLPARDNSFALHIEADGFAPFDKEGISPSEIFDIGDLVLSRGCVLQGNVTVHGSGATGVMVELHRGSADAKGSVRTTATNGDGTFIFSGVGKGEHTIVIRKKTRRLVERSVLMNGCDSIGPLQIEIGGTRVVGFATKRGNPIANTTLTLFPAVDIESPRATIIRRHLDENGKNITDDILGRGASAIISQTDASGFFEFSDVYAGMYRITMPIADGALVRTITVPDAEVANISVDFGGQSVTGTVLDAGTHLPIPNAIVTLSSNRARTDALGRFELDVPDPTTAALDVAAAGYTKKSVPIDALTSNVQVELERAKLKVSGMVIAGSSAASVGVVRWLLSGQSAQTSGATLVRDDGSFQIDDLSPGRLTIAAYTPGFGIGIETVDLGVSDTAPSIKLQLFQPATLRVRLPQSSSADKIRFLKGGVDVTPLLWQFPGLVPTIVSESEWIWNFLGAGVLDLVLPNRRESVQLIPGRETIVAMN